MRRIVAGLFAMVVFACASLASAEYVPPSVFDSSGVDEGEASMLRAKIEGERFELGDTCYINGDKTKRLEVVGIGGNPHGPFQKVDVGNDTWLWSFQVIADLPEIETILVARSDSMDPRAIEASIRDNIMRDLKAAGVDVDALQKAMAQKAAAKQPTKGAALAPKPKRTKEELLAELQALEESGG